MSAVRVLHVDDEPDIREVVEISLGLDPNFSVRGCASGKDALAAAADWSPNLILLDVMMPGMDGPATLGHLRDNPRTAAIPVVFMTARAQPRELEQFVALGAEGVIPKPFDPMTLAASVRLYAGDAGGGFAARRASFLERARQHATELTWQQEALEEPAGAPAALDRIRYIAHAIAGAGGIFGLVAMSREASELESLANALLEGAGVVTDIAQAIEVLVARIEAA